MPLFGKKKGKEEKPKGPAYPTQTATAYPSQAAPAFQSQQQMPPPMAYAGYAAPPGPYFPPPSYSSVSTPAPPQAYPAGFQNNPPSYTGPPPTYAPAGAAAPYGAGQYQPAPAAATRLPSTVYVANAFDPGARFDVGSKPNIPPPPPGYAPNATQMASMQGCNMVLGQRQANWVEGGSSGGVSFF